MERGGDYSFPLPYALGPGKNPHLNIRLNPRGLTGIVRPAGGLLHCDDPRLSPLSTRPFLLLAGLVRMRIERRPRFARALAMNVTATILKNFIFQVP